MPQHLFRIKLVTLRVDLGPVHLILLIALVFPLLFVFGEICFFLQKFVILELVIFLLFLQPLFFLFEPALLFCLEFITLLLNLILLDLSHVLII